MNLGFPSSSPISLFRSSIALLGVANLSAADSTRSATVASGPSVTAAEPVLEPLFNGKDLTNFRAEESKDFWRIENGILIGENNSALKANYLPLRNIATSF